MVLKKKPHPNFNVPNYGTRSRSRVPARWRKQRGIDNKKRIKKDFMGAEPTIGYKNPDSLMHIRASGRRQMIVRNPNELRALIQANTAQQYDITIAAPVSRRKRAEMTKLAEQGKIELTNGIKAEKQAAQQAKAAAMPQKQQPAEQKNGAKK